MKRTCTGYVGQIAYGFRAVSLLYEGILLHVRERFCSPWVIITLPGANLAQLLDRVLVWSDVGKDKL